MEYLSSLFGGLIAFQVFRFNKDEKRVENQSPFRSFRIAGATNYIKESFDIVGNYGRSDIGALF